MINMNLCNYLKNNETLYGLIVVNLNTKSRYISKIQEFLMEMDSDNIMLISIHKFNFDPDKIYIQSRSYTAGDKMDFFFKRTGPFNDELDLWVYL